MIFFVSRIIMAIFTCALLLLIPYATSVTFNFTDITRSNDPELILQDTAYISDEGIEVTSENMRPDPDSTRSGRATYIEPLHLWDNTSRELASFSTRFSFVIDSYGQKQYGDGLTFFLAKNNSITVPGGAMGLPFNFTANQSMSPFVAVEFDSYCNFEFDPEDPEDAGPFSCIRDHVGININSVTSVVYKKWNSNIQNASQWDAFIGYDSVSKNLSVSFTSSKYNIEDGLDYTIDLRDVLPEWVIFGFSAATGELFEKNNVRSWMFNSSILNVDESNGLPPTTSPGNIDPIISSAPTKATDSQNAEKRKNHTSRMVGFIVGLLIVVALVVAIVLFVLWRRMMNKGDGLEGSGLEVEMNNEFEMGATMPRKFSYLELAQSTTRFAETEKLGEGGFGGVYKGFLKDSRTYIAVKRVSKSSKQGIKEYTSEVRIISRLRHRNLVQLTGWCHEKAELLLVYEFMENGSLDLHLFKGKSLLTWGTRYKIAHGLASALMYLHEEWEQCVLHRDIKSSNVMLDSSFNAKLGDFGLARLVDHEKGFDNTTILAGTIGYMAPEYLMTGKPSKESDVFSFGVVALEIACGRKAIDSDAPERMTKLVNWVWGLYETGTLLEAADPCLGSDFAEDQMVNLMIVGLWCAHPDPQLRPSIRQAIQVLKFEASLPILPAMMPKVTYYASPTSSIYGGNSSGKTQASSSILATSLSTSSASPSVSLLHST